MKTVHMNVWINQNDLKTQDFFMCMKNTIDLGVFNIVFSSVLVWTAASETKHRLVQFINISKCCCRGTKTLNMPAT